ncbi:transporter substrate-binding domain-containing protein [Blastococcus sp. SYSU D00669]
MPLLCVAALTAACGGGSDADSDSEAAATSAEATEDGPQFFDLLPADIQQSGVITVVGDIQAPLRFQDSAGEIVGVQADFLDAMAPLLGVEFEQATVESFANIQTSVEAGRYDMAWGGIADSVEREATLDIVTHSVSAPTFMSAKGSGFSEPVDLCGRNIALISSSVPLNAAFDTLTALCQEEGEDAPTKIDLAQRADLQLAVQSGRADAYGTTPAEAAYTTQQAEDKWEFFIADEDPFVVTQLGAAFTKDNTELRDAIHAALQELFDNGTYEEIMTEWGMEGVTIPEPEINPAGAAAGGDGSSTPATPSN